jgi:phosphoadenosine phosphosulfate reductase
MNAISLYAKPSADFAQKLSATAAVLRDAQATYRPMTLASSLGAEDMVITHLLHTLGIDSEIFVLNTGKLHAETLQLLATVQTTYGINRVVRVYEPETVVAAEFVARNGEDAMYKSIDLRKACCEIRKTIPLEKALAGKKAWVTGLRREQSNARAEVAHVEQQPLRAKINPLADWTNGDVWHYISINQVPYNALHDQFYPSIGCAPCTRAVTLGEDIRSGRWWWESEAAKECGLHVDSSSLRAIPVVAIA